jgi:hypothetical protein
MILAARKLIDLDPSKPSMAKGFFAARAFEDAVFTFKRIDKSCPRSDCAESRRVAGELLFEACFDLSALLVQ